MENEIPQVVTENVTSASPLDVDAQLKNMKGHFVGSLQRTFKDIRNDRALTIAQKAKRSYKRKVEDLIDDINQLQLRRMGNLDLSPNDRNTIMQANNFDPDKFVVDDLEIAKDIENKKIVLRLAVEQYEYLFGEKISY